MGKSYVKGKMKTSKSLIAVAIVAIAAIVAIILLAPAI